MTTCAANYVFFQPKTNKLTNLCGLGTYRTCAVCGKTFHTPSGAKVFKVKGKPVCGWNCKRRAEH